MYFWRPLDHKRSWSVGHSKLISRFTLKKQCGVLVLQNDAINDKIAHNKQEGLHGYHNETMREYHASIYCPATGVKRFYLSGRKET